MSQCRASTAASSMNRKNPKGTQSDRTETKAGTSSSANKAHPKPTCRAHSGLKFIFKKKPIKPLLDFDIGFDHSEINPPIQIAAVSIEGCSSPIKIPATSNENETEIVSSARNGVKPNQPLNDTKLEKPTKGAKPNRISVKVTLQEIAEDVKSPLLKEIQTQLMPKDSKIPMLSSGTRPQLPSMTDKSSRDVKAVQELSDTKPGLQSNPISKEVKLETTQPSAAEVDSKVKSFPRKVAVISNGDETVSSARDGVKPNQPLNDTKLEKPTKGVKPNHVSVNVNELQQVSKDIKSSPLKEIQTPLMPKESKIPMLTSGTRHQPPSTTDKSSRDVKAVQEPSDTKLGLQSNQTSKEVKLGKAQPSAAEVNSKMSTRKSGMHSGMKFHPKKQPTVAQPFRFHDAHLDLKKKCPKE